MSRTIEALRAMQDSDGEFYAPTDAQSETLRALIAEHDRDPIGCAARDLVAAIALHAPALPDDKRRFLNRQAGNLRKI